VKAYAAVGIDAPQGAAPRRASPRSSARLSALDADFKIAQKRARRAAQAGGKRWRRARPVCARSAAIRPSRRRLGPGPQAGPDLPPPPPMGPVGIEGGKQSQGEDPAGGWTMRPARPRAGVDRLKGDVQKIADDPRRGAGPHHLRSGARPRREGRPARRAAGRTPPTRPARPISRGRCRPPPTSCRAEADRIRAAEADTVPGQQPPGAPLPPSSPRKLPQPAPARWPPRPVLGEANLRAEGYEVDRIFMDSVPGPISRRGVEDPRDRHPPPTPRRVAARRACPSFAAWASTTRSS